MHKYVIIIIALFCGLTILSQEAYLKSQFIRDKKVLEKEAYQKLKKQDIYKQEDSLRIVFMYCFKEFDFTESEIKDNQYLERLEPSYKYSNFLLPTTSWYIAKFPIKKRLSAKGYVINKNNELVGTIISTNGYPFCINPFIYYSGDNEYLIQSQKDYENLKNDVLITNYGLCFYTEFKINIIWCISNNETRIYDIKRQKFFTLKDYYECCWRYYSPDEILHGKWP